MAIISQTPKLFSSHYSNHGTQQKSLHLSVRKYEKDKTDTNIHHSFTYASIGH